MRRFGRVVFGGTVAMAIAMAVAAPVRAAGVRTVKSGVEAPVYSRAIFYRNTCSYGAIPTLQIGEQPQHGSLSIRTAEWRIHDVSLCDGKPVRGAVVFYRSAKGYHGGDRFVVETREESSSRRGSSRGFSDTVLIDVK